MGETGVGTLLTDKPRREIQVVVVEEDGRVRVLLELVGDGVSEPAVDLHVPAVPGLVERLVEGR